MKIFAGFSCGNAVGFRIRSIKTYTKITGVMVLFYFRILFIVIVSDFAN